MNMERDEQWSKEQWEEYKHDQWKLMQELGDK